jgi:hypothetical protein
MFRTSKVKRRQKIRMGATRRILQAQPKILKKTSEHQIYQSKGKFSLKSEKKPKTRAQPKILKKMIGTPNVPNVIKKKVFPKEVCLVP